MTGYHPDPKDFNIVSSRIYRILTLRKMLEPFLTQDQGDEFYRALTEKALAWLSAIHDGYPDTWTNPNVNFEPAEDRFLFIWNNPLPCYVYPFNQYTLSIDALVTTYQIRHYDNPNTFSILDHGTLNSFSDILPVWESWIDLV